MEEINFSIKKGSYSFRCTPDDMHPYECNGLGHCIHCDKDIAPNHNPSGCALCDWKEEK